jgi:ABC-2 type transport system ATP-binding protein
MGEKRMTMIEVNNLRKDYTINKRPPGISGIFKSMFKPERMIKKAVDGISFQVEKGEILGFIGPNGAGKSTTIKMLTGILVPTEGELTVAGMVPYQERKKYSKNIGVVFGQRTQLWWNLPLRESYDLIRTIYEVPDQVYRDNLKLFSDILDIDELLDVPVRQLSLGQRMKAEIAASLLHNPDIVYLDEPTIGLDIVSKERIREFIKKLNKETGVTVILTTHDMSDIESLCSRIMIIDHGRLIYNGNIHELKKQYGGNRVLLIDFEEEPENLALPFAEITKMEGARRRILFSDDQISSVDLIHQLSSRFKVKDFALQDTNIEDVIKLIYENRNNFQVMKENIG